MRRLLIGSIGLALAMGLGGCTGGTKEASAGPEPTKERLLLNVAGDAGQETAPFDAPGGPLRFEWKTIIFPSGEDTGA